MNSHTVNTGFLYKNREYIMPHLVLAVCWRLLHYISQEKIISYMPFLRVMLLCVFQSQRGVAPTNIVATDFNPLLQYDNILGIKNRRFDPYKYGIFWQDLDGYQLILVVPTALISFVFMFNGLKPITTKYFGPMALYPDTKRQNQIILVSQAAFGFVQ